MSSVKGTAAYWKQFLYNVLAMVEQLGIPRYSRTLPCADLRWEQIPYIISKLNNLGLSGKELKIWSYQERCNLLNNNPVLVASHFQYKVQVFIEIILNGKLSKKNIMLYALNFKKGIAHMPIHFYKFSMHQILEISCL